MQDHVFQPNLKCSQLLAQILAALRGDLDEDAFFSDVLNMGVTAKLQQFFQLDGDSAYNRAAANPEQYRAVRDLLRIKPAGASAPTAVAAFPRDVTRHKSIS